MTVTVALEGLEVFGHHGVEEEERERGQRFLFDVDYDAPEAALSDRIDDAVDYRHVAACVKAVSDGRRYALLEALAAATADAILHDFPVDRVRVRVRKPDVELGIPVDHTAATVERRR